MARPRTRSIGLPDRLTLENGFFRYARPDRNKRIGLTSNKEYAIQIAEEMNLLFGVDGIPKPKNCYIETAQLNKDDYEFSTAMRHYLPDLFGLIHISETEVKRHKLDAKFAGNEYIDLQSFKSGAIPIWGIVLLRQFERNAKRRKINYRLTHKDFADLILRSQGLCEVTGVKLCLDKSSLKEMPSKRPWAPSIDRIDSKVGYVKMNCRIVCVAANYAMQQWGEVVLRDIAKSMLINGKINGLS